MNDFDEEAFLQMYEDALVQIEEERYEDARETLQELLANGRDRPEGWCLEAQLKMVLGEWEEAEVALSFARQLDPLRPETCLVWADYSEAQEDYRGGMDTLFLALKEPLAPEHREALAIRLAELILNWGALAVELDEQGLLDEEEDDTIEDVDDKVCDMLDLLDDIDVEEDAWAWASQARLLQWLERDEEALEAWQRAVALTPDDVEYVYGLAKTYEDLEMFEEAHIHYNEVFSLESVLYSEEAAWSLMFEPEIFKQAANEAWLDVQMQLMGESLPFQFEFTTEVYPTQALMEESHPTDLFDPRVGLHVAFSALSEGQPKIYLQLFQRNIERDMEGDDPTELKLAILELLETCVDRIFAILDEPDEEDW
ncbi:MAG: hypothetical protein CL920_31275 [Deltaproteobacteria bacterium]|nr:hypothetical protein [Deltaproteobacteria bacterium]